MRCSDVTRELSAPTGSVNPAALEAHLAGCVRCASWAEQSTALDRVWESTRPAELSDAAWERIWSEVSPALEPWPSARPDTSASPSPRPRSAVMAFVVAEAAAIFLGFTALMWTAGRPAPLAGPAAPAVAQGEPRTNENAVASLTVRVDYEFGEDEVPLISLDNHSVRDVVQNENPYAIDPFGLPVFNNFESLASLQ